MVECTVLLVVQYTSRIVVECTDSTSSSTVTSRIVVKCTVLLVVQYISRIVVECTDSTPSSTVY